MSQISRVIKNKNRIDKENRKRRSKEIRDMREFAMYRNRLSEDMKMIELILDDDEVSSITINLSNERTLYMFMQFMYLEEFAEYTVTQVDNNNYNIRHKVVKF